MPPSRRETRRARRRSRQPAGRSVRRALTVAAVLFGAVVLGAGVLVARTMATLPSVTHIPPLSVGSILYDRYGQPITQLHGAVDAQPVPLSEIPVYLREAVVATEDASFYTNPGFDLKGIVRAALADLTGRGTLQGASTISEQLGKMLYLHDNQSLSYKVKEVLLGISLDRTYTKDQILDMYLNRIYLGAGAVGVQAASEIYFGKPVSQLDLAQCALLAGLPQAPSYYDPLVNPQAALQRRNEVLKRMVVTGYISPALAARTEKLPLELSPQAGSVLQSYPDPWFVDAVIAQLEQHGFSSNQLFSGGLRIYTTLDPRVQAAAQQAVEAVMSRLPAPPQGPQAAEVVMDPGTGDVLAVVGGRVHPPGYLTAEDLATSGRFQTGSAIKPLAEYPTAIEHRDTEFTVVEDAPFLKHHGQWWPQNDNHVYEGAIPLKYALAISDNNASVRLELSGRVGVQAAWNTAVHQFGLPLSPADRTNPALGLGGLTQGVTPLEMTAAYATYANHGVRPRPRFVVRVVGPQGQVLWNNPIHATPEVTPQVAYVLTDMMEAVFTHPGATAYGQGIGRPAAGKTGTAQNGEEGWFCGFTPQLVACAWEGFPIPRPQPGVYGATYALPIWRQTMLASLRGQPVLSFLRPPGIVERRVDIESGMLPSPLTPKADIATGVFLRGTEPTRVSDVWVEETVVKGDPHRLWTPGCPLPPAQAVFLKKPQGLLPHAPLPLDHVLWPPTLVCGSGGSSPSVPSPSLPSPTPLSQNVVLTVQGGVILPSTVTVTAGLPVNLTVVNQDPAAYVLEIPGENLLANVLPEATAHLSFTPTSPGQEPFVLIGGKAGGTLHVVSPQGGSTTSQGQAPPPGGP